jgi:hypothetical protein
VMAEVGPASSTLPSPGNCRHGWVPALDGKNRPKFPRITAALRATR